MTTTHTEPPFGREWYDLPAVLPADCPAPGCVYSANTCLRHDQNAAATDDR